MVVPETELITVKSSGINYQPKNEELKGIYNNNGLYVQIVSGNQVADRVVLTNTTNTATPNSKNYKISLSVTYTKL